jgi:hypothetical protein
MMELHERVPLVQSKADLSEFVAALARDLQERRAEWENDTLDQYLLALARWLEDSDGYYQHHDLPVPTTLFRDSSRIPTLHSWAASQGH